ncbi:SDR family oxidoreductase [Acinetobacter sp. Ac_5812]|uniref:SDR family NAD(P)-dependent oxidoreductase n=1 Tax=Acinetobacter sp. Ac_5812 TaxID=1848937 RepID=UPI00148F4EB7|nr:SDR family oxidoreductase [Acinetobacter sp. Ac_5812]NNP69396.1 hypothetical protein [Acinetobacter sp. Ac_5812]
MQKGTEIFSLKGKTALITGATGYLGTSMALILAEAGAKVLVNSRSVERCNVLVQKILDAGFIAESAAFDVSSLNEIQSFALKQQGNPIHIIINNAYVGGAGNIEVSGGDSYLTSYDITLVAAHNLIQTLLPNLRLAVEEKQDASIINIASMYAMVSPDQSIYVSSKDTNPPFYGAAKAALLQWTKYAACEFGAEKIRVNAISPGPFPSEQVQITAPSFIKTLSKKVPMERIGQTEEIKGPTLFLASSASSYVNGTNIVVDGGWTCW